MCERCTEGELVCDLVGRCEAAEGERSITNCIHCGKELHEKDEQWWTWDADQFTNPKPQCFVT